MGREGPRAEGRARRRAWGRAALLAAAHVALPCRAQEPDAGAPEGGGAAPANDPGTNGSATRAALEAELGQERRARDEAQAELDAMKGGKLMSHGITGGVALAVQTPFFSLEGISQRAADVVAMPYVMVLPGYWTTNQAMREYCASAWGAGNEHDATAAALAVARKRGTYTYEAIRNALRAGRQPEDIGHDYFEYETPADEADAKRLIAKVSEVIAAEQRASRAPSPAERKQAKAEADEKRDVAIQELAYWEWPPTKRHNCAARQLGAWVGVPARYEVATKIVDDDESTLDVDTREVTPVVAFGVAYTPNAYFSILAGVTYATVPSTLPDGRRGSDRPFWAGTVAVGGNLDLLGFLVD